MCQNSVFAKFWVIKNEVFEKKIAFFVFFFFMLENRNRKKKKKQKRENSKKPYKNRVFWRWSCENVKNQKNWIFSKNCLTLFVSGRETKNAHFRCNYLFWPKFFFGPKQCKAENTIKIGVSAEIAKKQKWHLFWEKGVFWHGWKSGFY